MNKDEDAEEGVVLSIVPRLPTLPDDDGREPPPLAEERTNLCAHHTHTALIDRNARTLTCSRCGADIEPYDYIAYLAHNGSRLVETRKRYRALAKRVEELLAEEKRVKARVKRWRAKDGSKA